jgi:uncharacterized protein DUF6941
MIPCPRAQGLTLCDYVMREEGTLKVSLVGTFTGMRTDAFPFSPRPFCVFAALTDGLGQGTLELTITHLASDEEIYTLRRPIDFPNRFMDVQVLIRLSEFSFPEEGLYLFSLAVDDDTVAQRRVRVHSTTEMP